MRQPGGEETSDQVNLNKELEAVTDNKRYLVEIRQSIENLFCLQTKFSI